MSIDMIIQDLLNIVITNYDVIPNLAVTDETATDTTYNLVNGFMRDYISDKPFIFTVQDGTVYFGSVQLRDIILGFIAVVVFLPTIFTWIANFNKKRDIARNENTELDIVYRRLLRQEQEEILDFEEHRELVERRLACRRLVIDPNYTKENDEKRKVPDRRLGTDRRHHGDIYIVPILLRTNNGRRATDNVSTQ